MTKTLEIGLLVYSGAQMAAVYGLTDLFAVANRVREDLGASDLPVLRISHWSGGSEGQAVMPVFDTHPALPHRPTVIIVPPSLTQMPSAAELEQFSIGLRQWHSDGALLVSVCVGVFFIAAAGLLDGRSATTHWNFAQTLAEHFPKVRVEANLPIFDDGDIITSAGLMVWCDLGLKLVERYLGPSLAAETARFLEVQLACPEQLPNSSFTPKLSHGDEAVLKVQHWLQSTGARDVSLTAMATHAGLEERTFLRRFRSATGLKPTEYCQQVRVGKACKMLEFTNRTIDQIAWGVGYQDPGAFRKVFLKFTGFAPSDYRRRFGAAARPAARA
jgi:transcriptional regulator GlxA family with amidase domain